MIKIGYKGAIALKVIGVLVSLLLGYLLYQKETNNFLNIDNGFTIGFIFFGLTMMILVCIYGIKVDVSERKEKISKQNSVIKDIIKTDDKDKEKHREELLNKLFNER